MTDPNPDRNPEQGSPKGTNSTEYRIRLLNKLTCLISVLEVAIGKISHSMAESGSNKARLKRIKTNLENTLSICRRARKTLEEKLACDPEAPASPQVKTSPSMSFRNYVELSSIDEFRKFKNMKAITPEEIGQVDMDEIMKRLLGEEPPG